MLARFCPDSCLARSLPNKSHDKADMGIDMSHSVADRIGALLSELGARYCFGVIGTANFKLTHAIVSNGVPYCAARHEGNAAAMADAYAKSTGSLTLLSVHSGPGLTNALTGIGEAAKSRTPLL